MTNITRYNSSVWLLISMLSIVTHAEEKEKSKDHRIPIWIGGIMLNSHTPNKSLVELGVQNGPLFVGVAQTAYSTKDTIEAAIGVQEKTNITALKAEYTVGQVRNTGYGIGAGVYNDSGKSENQSNDGRGYNFGIFIEFPLLRNTIRMLLNLLTFERMTSTELDEPRYRLMYRQGTPHRIEETTKSYGSVSISFRVRL